MELRFQHEIRVGSKIKNKTKAGVWLFLNEKGLIFICVWTACRLGIVVVLADRVYYVCFVLSVHRTKASCSSCCVEWCVFSSLCSSCLKKLNIFLFLYRKSWQIGVHIAINEIPMPALLCSVSVFYAGRCGCVGCITASSFVIDLKWEYVFLL